MNPEPRTPNLEPKRGRFIVIYGINNLGKSTQAKKLVERMNTEGFSAEYMKYPVYDIEPSGKMVNDYLRNGNPFGLSHRESQILNVVNRMQATAQLQEMLHTGTHVVGEDYTGSGLAWGIGTGVDEAFMKRINSHLRHEDMAFVFTGTRFTEATEETHVYETQSSLQDEVGKVYARLGKEFGWIEINANGTIEEIHEAIWSHVTPLLHRSQ